MWYRLLGIAALVGQRLSRQRVNLIPLNWPAMAGLIGLAIWSLVMVRDGVVNGTTPRTVPLADLLTRKGDLGRNFVRTTGMVVPQGQLTKVKRDKNTGAETIETVWVPIADSVSKKILLIERANAVEQGTEPHAETVQGMLVPIDSSVRHELESYSSTSQTALDMDYMLVEGKTPAQPAIWIPTLILSSLFGVAMVWTFLRRYIVWRGVTTGSIPQRPSRALPDTLSVYATGEFLMSGSNHQDRFLEVPVGISFTPTGDALAYSRINASNKFMGFVTQDRDGTWVLPLGNPRGQSVEVGEIYLGAKCHYALRWKTEAGKTVLLSTDTQDEREALLDALAYQPPPSSQPSPSSTVE
jgi:hypothetical protein